MLVDAIIHAYHQSAEDVIRLSEEGDKDAQVKAAFEWRYAADLNHAVRYWLDIRQVENFRHARFEMQEFPPMVHDKVFVEFSGLLQFDFRPWDRPELIIGKEGDMNPPPIKPKSFSDGKQTFYKGVFLHAFKPPHQFVRWPDETVIRAFWYEKLRYVHVGQADDARVEGRDFPLIDNYTVSMSPSSWPRRMDPFNVLERDEAAHPGEKDHGERLFRMTVNLLYFLAAENVVRVRIRPGDHDRHGRDLAGLPKSNREYHVLPFQLPRYRYLHKSEAGSSGRHLSVCHDVRGHFRHLRDERFERNEDGTVRIVWIDPFQRGAGLPYQPRVRAGKIDSLFLDYDKFIREEVARTARRKGGSHVSS